jgi:hypothetical protein
VELDFAGDRGVIAREDEIVRSSPRRAAMPSAAAMWPCGERTISKPSPAGRSVSSRSAARSAAIFSGFHLVRLAKVRFLTVPSSQ